MLRTTVPSCGESSLTASAPCTITKLSFCAIAIGGWLLAAIVWAAHRGYADAVFWESIAVAVPAGALVLSSLGLLVPRLRPERAREPVPSEH